MGSAQASPANPSPHRHSVAGGILVWGGIGVDSRQPHPPGFAGVTVGKPYHFHPSYVAHRGIGNCYENSQRQVPRPHPSGCGSPQNRHSRESGNPGSRDVGGRCESPTPYPWIPACAGMTVGRPSPTAHFSRDTPTSILPRRDGGGWIFIIMAGPEGRIWETGLRLPDGPLQIVRLDQLGNLPPGLILYVDAFP